MTSSITGACFSNVQFNFLDDGLLQCNFTGHRVFVCCLCQVRMCRSNNCLVNIWNMQQFFQATCLIGTWNSSEPASYMLRNGLMRFSLVRNSKYSLPWELSLWLSFFSSLTSRASLIFCDSLALWEISLCLQITWVTYLLCLLILHLCHQFLVSKLNMKSRSKRTWTVSWKTFTSHTKWVFWQKTGLSLIHLKEFIFCQSLVIDEELFVQKY